MGKRTFMNGAYGRTMRRGGRRGGGDRGIGGVGLPPLPVGGANHRWLSTAGITEDGSGVLTWEDVIGGVVMDRSGATGPAVTTNGQVKQPVVRFDGGISNVMSSDAIEGSTVFNAGNDHTVIVMASPNSAVVSNHQFFSASQGALNTSEYAFRINTTPQLIMIRNGSALSIATERPHFDTFSRMIARWDDSGNAFGARVNGIEQAIGNTGDPIAAQDRYTIGASPTLTSNVLGGDVCEVIVYDRRLTDAETTAIDQYLVARYFETVIHELGAQAWWDPTDNANISIDAGGVDAYTDKIGGAVLSQATPSKRPTVVQSERTGHAMLAFDLDADQTLIGATSLGGTFDSAAPHTIYAETVLAPDLAGAETRMIFAAYDAANPATEVSNIAVGGSVQIGQAFYSGGGANKTSNGEGVYKGAARWLYGGIDGSLQVVDVIGGVQSSRTHSPASASGIDTIALGSRGDATHYDGEIGDAIVFGYALTAAQHLRVQAYIEGRWTAPVPFQLGAVAQWDPTRNDLISIDAGGVDAYTDAIGGAVLVQATPGARPALVDSIRTGHQMMKYSGAQLLRDSASALAGLLDDAAQHTIYVESARNTFNGSVRETILSMSAGATLAKAEMRQETTGVLEYLYRGTVPASEQSAGYAPTLKAARWDRFGINSSGDLTIQHFREAEATGVAAALAESFDRITVGAGGDDVSPLTDTEVGQLVVFLHDLNARDSALMQQSIQDSWLPAEVPLRLGADIYLDAEDLAVAGDPWVDRVGGPDFVTVGGTPALVTMNGRKAVDFGVGDGVYSRFDATADASRTDSTQALVMETAGTDSTNYALGHYDDASAVGATNRCGYGFFSSPFNALMVRRDAAQTNFTLAPSAGAEGDRHIAIYTYEDGEGKSHFDGVETSQSITKTLAVTQDRTSIGGRTHIASQGFEGTISFYAQFAHVMNDDDRATLEDYLFDRFFNWAAAENTLGAIDDLAIRLNAADLSVSGLEWPSAEGSLHPVTLEAPGPAQAAARSTAPELGNRPVAVLDGEPQLEVDLGVVSLFDVAWSFLAVTVRRNLNSGVFLRLSSDAGGPVSTEVVRLQVSGNTALAQVLGAGAVSMFTTEELLVGEAGVIAVACDNTGVAADVMLNGVIQAFAGTAQAPTTLRYLAVGARSDDTGRHPGDVAEIRAVSRRLGKAELIAFQRYVDIAYLDPGLVA